MILSPLRCRHILRMAAKAARIAVGVSHEQAVLSPAAETESLTVTDFTVQATLTHAHAIPWPISASSARQRVVDGVCRPFVDFDIAVVDLGDGASVERLRHLATPFGLLVMSSPEAASTSRTCTSRLGKMPTPLPKMVIHRVMGHSSRRLRLSRSSALAPVCPARQSLRGF